MKTKQTFAIKGMHCASCVYTSEKALKAIPGVTDAVVNLATGKATLTTDSMIEKNKIIVRQLLPNAQKSVKEGISSDDTILEINDKKVITVDEIDAALNAIKNDADFSIKIKHVNTENTIQLKKIVGNFKIQMKKSN